MIVDLRTALLTYLKTLHPRVYYNRAPEDKEYPYIVFSFEPSFTPDEAGEQMLIDIDGWDNPADGSSIALEQLMETINGDGDLQNPTGLDRQIVRGDETIAIFKLESRDSIDDEDPRILRRHYKYDTMIYQERSEP